MFRQHPEEIINIGCDQILIMPDGREERLIDGVTREQWVNWEFLERFGEQAYGLRLDAEAGQITHEEVDSIVARLEVEISAQADELFGKTSSDS